MLERRLQIALRILNPGKWESSSEIAGRSALYSTAHSVANALGRLHTMGLVEDRQKIKSRREWLLTKEGEEARAQCLTIL